MMSELDLTSSPETDDEGADETDSVENSNLLLEPQQRPKHPAVERIMEVHLSESTRSGDSSDSGGSFRSKERNPNFRLHTSSLEQLHRPKKRNFAEWDSTSGYSSDSGVSLRSNMSKDGGLYFKNKPRFPSGRSLSSAELNDSDFSLKSDRSKDEIIDFRRPSFRTQSSTAFSNMKSLNRYWSTNEASDCGRSTPSTRRVSSDSSDSDPSKESPNNFKLDVSPSEEEQTVFDDEFADSCSSPAGQRNVEREVPQTVRKSKRSGELPDDEFSTVVEPLRSNKKLKKRQSRHDLVVEWLLDDFPGFKASQSSPSSVRSSDSDASFRSDGTKDNSSHLKGGVASPWPDTSFFWQNNLAENVEQEVSPSPQTARVTSGEEDSFNPESSPRVPPSLSPLNQTERL